MRLLQPENEKKGKEMRKKFLLIRRENQRLIERLIQRAEEITRKAI